MRAAGCGNARNGATRGARIRAQGQIGDRNDADQSLLPIEHWQPPDLVVGHVLCDVLDVFVLEAVEDFLAHYLTDRRLRRLSLGYRTGCDIPVGDHTYQSIV